MKRAIAIAVGVLALLLFTGASQDEHRVKYPSPSELALSSDGRWLFAVCEGTNEVVIVDTATQRIAERVPVGRVPRGITLSADGKRAWVANSWDDSVSEIDLATRTVSRTLPAGYEPTGVVTDGAGESLYVTNRLSNDISIVNLKSGKEDQRLLAGRGASYAALSPDGATMYATHIYPNVGRFRTLPVSEITEVDTQRHVVGNREWLKGSAGVFHVAFSNDGRLGVAAEVRPKNLIPLAHVEHDWVFTNSLAVFGADAGGHVVHMPLDELDRVLSLPYAVAVSADKRFVYVSASSSDEVGVVDATKMLQLVRSPNSAGFSTDLSAAGRYIVAHIPVGRNPRALALSPDGSKLYVAARMDDAIDVIDTAKRTVVSSIPMGGPDAITPERRGERLFNSGRFAFHQTFGCANCHIDLTIDGLEWDLEPDGFGIDIVDNRSLEDVSHTAPFKWNGGNPDLETECGPRTERFFYRSEGYNREELEDLTAFIKSIPLRPNRYRQANGELTPAQDRGKTIFERTRKRNGEPIPQSNQCAFCHSGPYYTNQKLADVGSGKSTDRSPMVDAAHLTNVVYSAPYLHDGSARTMEEIWTVFNPNDTHGQTNDLNKDELNDLIEYLKTL